MSHWISCKKQMPSMPQMNYVLAWGPTFNRIRLLGWYNGATTSRWYDEADNVFYGEVTHWQPLPSTPNIIDLNGSNQKPTANCIA